MTDVSERLRWKMPTAEEGAAHLAAKLEDAILAGVNDFIDPPNVSGIGLDPRERREFARCIRSHIEAYWPSVYL